MFQSITCAPLCRHLKVASAPIGTVIGSGTSIKPAVQFDNLSLYYEIQCHWQNLINRGTKFNNLPSLASKVVVGAESFSPEVTQCHNNNHYYECAE